jgi:hypothetical protein
VFRLQFGKAREATALMKEGVAAQKKALAGTEILEPVVTDLTGAIHTGIGDSCSESCCV